MSHPSVDDHQAERTPERRSDPAPATATEAGKAGQLDSPLKPLLWLLIPFILILIYGFLNPN